MSHKPINIQNLELLFPHKICFEDFSCQIYYGNRIAIIGRNGIGKSTILKIIKEILSDADISYSYVPQIIYTQDNLSGGEKLNTSLRAALTSAPDVLLLDEPTNHLDSSNKSNLMRMLKSYLGTLIIVSHDKELLRNCVDILWHIENAKVHIFSGGYDDYISEIQSRRASVTRELLALDRQHKTIHEKLMKEQERASKRKTYGEKKYKDDKLALRAAQGRGENTHNKNKSRINDTKSALLDQLASLRIPEVIVPKFSIDRNDIGNKTLVQISSGSVGYFIDNPILADINFTLYSKDRIAILGNNGSGKSTIVKAILGCKEVLKSGDWFVIKKDDIGYLDQHYNTLDQTKSVFEIISELMPNCSHSEVRKHLSDFLFRKNEEVNTLVSHLSGGEKTRLSLAQIAAKTPKLLILDEITNNLDRETKEHVIEVLREYPGAMIVISHDTNFLKEIDVQNFYLQK